MSFSTPIKILDASSGNSQEFYDNLFNSSLQNIKSNLSYRLAIVGSPLANIKAFVVSGYSNSSGYANKTTEFSFSIKVSCANWNGASVKIQAKTSHADDAFTDTGDIFTKDEAIDKLIYLNYQDAF